MIKTIKDIKALLENYDEDEKVICDFLFADDLKRVASFMEVGLHDERLNEVFEGLQENLDLHSLIPDLIIENEIQRVLEDEEL